MSRKDYIALAAALRATGRALDADADQRAAYAHAQYVSAVADVLQRDNSAFDRDRFLRAASAETE